jgi:hypothetical protein
VYKQIQFAKNRPIGYSRDGLISLPMSSDIHKHFDALREELVKSGTILSMAEATSPTTSTWSSTSGFDWKGKDPNLSIDFLSVGASYDYGRTVGWELKQGRDFSRSFATDSSAVILNEAAANFIGFKNPVGETVTWWGRPLTVVGVIHNMVMNSPYDEPKPTVFNLSADEQNVAILRINPAISATAALSKIEPAYKRFEPNQLFDYQFANEEYGKKFQGEERVGKLAGFFTLLAIVISCLGLFGLASFVAEQRTKEIGVRKVLGASVFSVWNLLSKDFIRLVLISYFISIPVAWYAMNRWLLDYKYRITINWEIFFMAGVSAIVIALVTVSFQAIKAAIANPAKSLRTE